MNIACIGIIPHVDRYIGIKCAKGRGHIMPGGKYDPSQDRTYHDCARREIWEETGITCNKMKYVWHAPDFGDYTTFAFLVTEYSGTVKQETKEGQVCAIPVEILMQSSFAAYYKILFEILTIRSTGYTLSNKVIGYEDLKDTPFIG